MLLLAEKVPITTSEVESQWWSTNPEPEKDFQARMQELLTQVRARRDCLDEPEA